ncbi:FkbM family methyltransferase [Pseudomonas mangiferae]|nr:FkbM family methyltransferase [Pseudomonas mangiferae]
MVYRPEPDDRAERLQDALARARRDGVVIHGAGNFARALRRACEGQGIPVRHFAVSAAPTTAEVDGVPVSALADVPAALRRSPLWIGVYNRGADAELTALRQAGLAAGFDEVRVPQEYFGWVAEAMGWRFWLAPLQAYAGAQAAIETAYGILADDESRATFAAMLDFRRALALERPLMPSPELQYFPASLRRYVAAGCVYLDGGAYDGDSIRQAAALLDLGRVYAFEPDPDNYARLAADLARQPLPAVCLPMGLSDSNAFLRFNAGAGEGSSLDPQGDSTIQVTRLDDLLVHERVDFLKLDIEGNEMPALEGARRLIASQRPFLAIAAYHRWDDLWRIPAFIHGLGLGYKVSLKLHETNSFESVFYAYH